ncbi:MAG: DUF4097 family beta strand repeat-containing protein [Janthinobacterium lividum]
MASTPPNFPQQPGDPNAPFDPTNINDPRYDRSRDPRYDPRWQHTQQKFYRDQQRAQANSERSARRAQAAAWRAQTRAQREQWKMYWRGQRRTSLIGPLLLIAVGVVFFLIHTGRIAPFAFFGWYAHWWPLLLIAIGVLRLAEWAIDRARQPEGAPVMRYSVGGGVVFGVVVLACLGLALHAGGQWRADRNGVGFVMPDWAHGNMDHFFGEKHEEDATPQERDIAPGGLLSIDNPHGDVTVNGTSDDGKVHLSVHKEVFANSDSFAMTRLRELSTVLDGTSDNLTLRVPSVESAGADLVLLVPASTRVVLNSNHGDVHVSNLKLPLSVTANSGDVEIAAITGAVQVHVNNRRRDLNLRSITGNISIDGNGDEVTLSDITGAATIRGDFYGGGHLQRVSGGVEYHSSRSDISLAHLNGELQLDGHDLTASEVVGPMLVNTRSRNVTLEKVTGDVKVVNNHGDVDVHVAPPTGSVTVDNQNGNVSVTLPERAKFTLSAETSDGDAHSDFSGSDTHGGRGVLNGTVNGGGAAIHLNTSHGDINISRNTMAPLPPAAPSKHVSTFGSVDMPAPSDMNDMLQMQRDAMATAAAALHQSAEQARQETKMSTQEARQRAREAMQQARDAIREAKEKEREAARLQKEAARANP